MPKQIILIVGALALLARLSLSVNGRIISAQEDSLENEAILTGTGIGQSMLREVAACNFDEQTIINDLSSPDSLTTVMALGPELGESYGSFDDMDDFKGLSRSIPTGRLGNFLVSVDVNYTTAALEGEPSFSPTFLKRIVVTVSGNTSLKNNIILKSIVAY